MVISQKYYYFRPSLTARYGRTSFSCRLRNRRRQPTSKISNRHVRRRAPLWNSHIIKIWWNDSVFTTHDISENPENAKALKSGHRGPVEECTVLGGAVRASMALFRCLLNASTCESSTSTRFRCSSGLQNISEVRCTQIYLYLACLRDEVV